MTEQLPGHHGSEHMECPSTPMRTTDAPWSRRPAPPQRPPGRQSVWDGVLADGKVEGPFDGTDTAVDRCRRVARQWNISLKDAAELMVNVERSSCESKVICVEEDLDLTCSEDEDADLSDDDDLHGLYATEEAFHAVVDKRHHGVITAVGSESLGDDEDEDAEKDWEEGADGFADVDLSLFLHINQKRLTQWVPHSRPWSVVPEDDEVDLPKL